MSGTLNLSNTDRISCDIMFLKRDDEIINIYDLFLSRNDAADIVGLPPETFNTLHEIANSIGNDADFLNTITTQINLERK